MRNALIFGWRRSLPGREPISGQHFEEFLGYLGAQKGAGKVQDFEPVFLNPHGAALQGFFLIRGTAAQLDALEDSESFLEHTMKASMHLDDLQVVRGRVGEAIGAMMQVWGKNIPK